MTLIPQWEENGGSTMILMLKKLPALVIALAFALGLFAAQALPPWRAEDWLRPMERSASHGPPPSSPGMTGSNAI